MENGIEEKVIKPNPPETRVLNETKIFKMLSKEGYLTKKKKEKEKKQ